MELVERALVEQAAKKSGLVWVSVGGGPARGLWHVWHDGAVHVVGEGEEQPLHGLASVGEAVVTARSKDTGGRIVSWPVGVSALEAGSSEWAAAAGALRARRLNAVSLETLLERWAASSFVLRLAASGPVLPLPDSSLSAPPVASGATTGGRTVAGVPRLLRRRGSRH